MESDIERLEAVYYTGPAPQRISVLTALGLLFDRVHFPNVRVPFEGVDTEWVMQEIKRIEESGVRDFGTWELLQLMRCTLHPELAEFCLFTGKDTQVFGGDDMKGADQLVRTLNEQIFGPPKAGFTPIFTPGHHKGLARDQAIDYPGPLYYQANALLYSGRNGIPLVNDDPRLPIPLVSGEQAKHNTKLLAMIMAIECTRLVLPEIGELQPEQIVEARSELKPCLAAFRRSMLRLAGQLNSAIQQTSDSKEIQRAAEFIAQTEVYPSIADLRAELEKSKQKGWIGRTWELTKRVPGIVAQYTMGNHVAGIQKTIAAFGSWIIAGATEDKPRSGLHYLLKMQEIVGTSQK